MHDRFDDLKSYGEITDGHTDWIKKLTVVCATFASLVGVRSEGQSAPAGLFYLIDSPRCFMPAIENLQRSTA